MTYYELRCETCQITHLPVLATEPGELLYPNFEENCPCCDGTRHTTSRLLLGLEEFHRKHSGHNLVEVKVDMK